jgi:protein TonB
LIPATLFEGELTMNYSSRSKTRSIASGLVFMVGGSTLVIGTLLMINRLAEAPERNLDEASASFSVERAPEPPPPQRSRPEAPPMVSLDSSLSGIDFGIPGLDANDLGGLQDQLLGDTADVVMTDDSVDSPPRPVYQAPLDYPRTARAQGVQGYVVLSLLISAAGEIEKVQVLEAEPSGIFEESAIQGVQNWRFEPAMYQGRSVKVWARQRIRFDLS